MAIDCSGPDRLRSEIENAIVSINMYHRRLPVLSL